MKLKTTIKYHAKDDIFTVDAQTENGKVTCISDRLFMKEESAEIAASIAKAMFSNISNENEFEFYTYKMALCVTLKLIGSPDSW